MACSSSEGKHPRRGGEDPCYAGRNTFDTETPPPRRGRHERPSKVTASYGNTPAEAGKTRLRTGSTSASGKHPRRGGEDTPQSSISRFGRETPPPRRGRRSHEQHRSGDRGNTPAEAGKTKWDQFEDFIPIETPPPRRGRLKADSLSFDITETPPPRRGRRRCSCQHADGVRNTPAEAGKTQGAARDVRPFKKHPRRGGEDALTTFSFENLPGNTPAEAGKTRGPS